MARYLFPGDTVFEKDEDAVEIGDGQVVTYWSQSAGGTQYTDLKAPDGVSAPNLVADANGNVAAVRGPDEVLLMWRDTGNSIRYPVRAEDEIQNRILQLQDMAATIASIQEQINSIPGGGTGVITNLDDVPDGQSYVRMTNGERAKLTTVATGATALTIGTTATTAKAGNYSPTPAQIGAVQNGGNVAKIIYTSSTSNTAPAGAVAGDFVIHP